MLLMMFLFYAAGQLYDGSRFGRLDSQLCGLPFPAPR